MSILLALNQVQLAEASIPIVISALKAFPDEIDVQIEAGAALATLADNRMVPSKRRRPYHPF